MKTHNSYLLVFLALQLSCLAQNKVLISGTVTDAGGKSGLSFATVALKRHLVGIVTNEAGSFDLYVPAEMMDDTLLVSYLGYRPQLIKVSTLQSPVSIRLQQSTVALNEVVVKPQPPEYYVKWAILSIKNNYPKAPFQNEAYYREKILENKNFIKCDEGIFKTYCPSYTDTVKSQHELLLFRQEKDLHEIQFMLKERKEEEEKDRKRVDKQNAKNKKAGRPADAKYEEQGNTGIDMATSFGGPESILHQGDFTKRPDNFLDTSEFKNYRYSFAKSSSYNNSKLMVIDYKSRGKVEHMRQQGRIYIDVATHAIVKVESQGDFVIPLLLRPILFFAGYGIENPTFESVIEFQQVKARWYPKNIQYNININISNKHLFRANEHSDFVIEGIYTVTKMNVENATPIPAEKRFNPKKGMQEQVHNEEGLTWEGINIIKK